MMIMKIVFFLQKCKKIKRLWEESCMA